MTGMAGITLAALSLVAVLGLGIRAQNEISAATDSLVEEQAIADSINQAVMHQLLAVSAIQAGNDSIARPDFTAAGQEAYTQIRRNAWRSRRCTPPPPTPTEKRPVVTRPSRRWFLTDSTC
jgi:hypothetical protein